MSRIVPPLLLIGLLVSGCAVEGEPFHKVTAPPRYATIYVYRPYHYSCSLLRPPVTCGDETARIGPGGYHAFVVPVGRTVCSVEGAESNDETEIDAQARVYYVREQFNWGVLSGHPHLEPIDEDTAHNEIAKCCVEEFVAQ